MGGVQQEQNQLYSDNDFTLTGAKTGRSFAGTKSALQRQQLWKLQKKGEVLRGQSQLFSDNHFIPAAAKTGRRVQWDPVNFEVQKGLPFLLFPAKNIRSSTKEN